MTEQDTARTIIFDLVRLEKLAVELERRYRIDPSARAEDVLADVGPEDQMLYLPQLQNLLEGLAQRKAEGTLEPMDPAQTHAVDVGDELHRSLMATALVEGSDTKGSAPSSHKISAGHNSGKATAESVPPDRIDQFRILRELGTGAFGVVYLAEDESLQRKVAIKVPKVSDPRRSESYIHEARKAAAIDCKGIVPIYHVGTKENGVPFVVQKLIDGPSLRVLLNRYGSLPPAHAVTLMRDIAVALASAHRLGIYHRDLKPDNVLLDGNGVPWIADFGLAISESEQAQRKGEIAGTLMYMSPEQIQGRADWLDGRSDIWALGIMLYELLLGKPPFSGKNRQSLMEQICHRQPRPLQQSSPTLASLNEIFQKCCAKSPSDRYGSVEELSDSLSLLIDAGLPTQPIDGSVIQLEQPISQYPSDGSQGNRSRSASGSGGMQSTGRAGSTMVGGGSGTEQDSGQRASSYTTATAQSVAAALEPAPMPDTSGHSARMVLVGIGIAAILAVGAQQWSSRWSQPVVSTVAATSDPVLPAVNPGTELELASGSTAVTGGANTDANSADAATMNAANMNAATEGQEKPANALSLSQANGSAELPWVVAADGSGSHQTIAAAIADSAQGAGGMFINIAPGTYVEALKITRPLTLVGLGEPSDCVIFNTEDSPLEIDCGLGTVRIANMAIRGDGRPSKKEFNAVELTSGKARLENCRIKTSTWNGVKVHSGTSFVASGCQFEESSFFAVSGLSHIAMEISDCQFLEAGIQVVEGAATIQRCTFSGNEGIYVERSGDVPTLVSDSHFVNSFDYGVVATTAGAVEIRESTFEGCKRGVQVNGGKAELSRCTMSKCTIGLEVVGGSAEAKEQTRITGGMFGCSMIGGSLRLVDVGLSEFSDSAVIALEHEKVELTNTTIQQCGTRGLTIKAGTLTITGGVIKDCADAGIYVGETFVKGELTGTHFENNLGAAIIQDSGDLACTDVSFTGSSNALLVYNPERPVNVSFQAVSAKQIDDVVVDLYGSVVLSIRDSQFDEVPEAKRFRALGGAEIKLYQAAN